MVSGIAITGASGFIGSHLVEGFAARGMEVLPLVHQLDERAARWPQARALEDIFRTPDGLAKCQVLVHAAAVRHRHGVTSGDYRSSNVALVERLLRAIAGRIRRLVLVSSVGVYGFPVSLPITERHPFAPATAYSKTKVEAEQLASRVARELGIELCIVRPTIVYGRGDTNGMLDKIVRMIEAGTYRVVGSGENTLHHTHVDDIVDGVFLTCTLPVAAAEDFILCGPETITLDRLSLRVADALGKRLPRTRVPLGLARGVASVIGVISSTGLAFSEREPPINHEKLDVMTRSIAFDAGKARRLLGYQPRVGYEEGLRRTLGGRS